MHLAIYARHTRMCTWCCTYRHTWGFTWVATVLHLSVYSLVPKSAQKNSCNSGPEAALEDKFHARLIVALEVEP